MRMEFFHNQRPISKQFQQRFQVVSKRWDVGNLFNNVAFYEIQKRLVKIVRRFYDEILANSAMKKIMKPLTVITIAVAITWPGSMLIFTIAEKFSDSVFMQVTAQYFGVVINMGIAVNYFIFYAFRYFYS